MERGAFREVDGSQVNEDLHNRISLDFKSLPLAVWRFAPLLPRLNLSTVARGPCRSLRALAGAPHFANNAALSALKLFIATQISVPECCAKRFMKCMHRSAKMRNSSDVCSEIGAVDMTSAL